MSQRDESSFATAPVDERAGRLGKPRLGTGRVGEQRAAPAHERAPCYARRGRIERPHFKGSQKLSIIVSDKLTTMLTKPRL